MRKAVVLLSVVLSAPALAAPAKSCRITLKGNSFDATCLPALSAKGTLVALAQIDPDGDQRRPNLRIMFYPVDGRTPASTVVLTVEESSASGGQLGDDLVTMIEPRLDLVNAQLSFAGFVPLKAATEPLSATAHGDQLELSGPHVATARYARQADCAATPSIGGAWLAEGRDLVVRVDGTCTGGPSFHVLRLVAPTPAAVVKAKAKPPQSSEAATALNNRAMRKLKAKDWTGAAADFRAAIERFADHVKAHYNLACLASLTGDRTTAIEQLRWLAASELPEAGEKLVKARTDPDLRSIRDDPDVQAILAQAGRNQQ